MGRASSASFAAATKSLYISHAVSHFYGTEYEIWAGCGPVGDLYIMTLCSSVAPMNEIYRRSCCNDVCENALDDGGNGGSGGKKYWGVRHFGATFGCFHKIYVCWFV